MDHCKSWCRDINDYKDFIKIEDGKLIVQTSYIFKELEVPMDVSEIKKLDIGAKYTNLEYDENGFIKRIKLDFYLILEIEKEK
jgi:hypothetical protein